MKIPERSGLTAEAVKENYNALIDYNQVWNREELVFPSLPMSETGKIHFEEVKRIFDGIQIACLISGLCLVFLIPLMLLLRKRRWLSLTGIMTLVVPAAAGILVLVDWQRFFVTFHQLVFRNDYWLFDPAVDPVITILPDGFFEQCAVLIVVLVLLAGIVCLSLGRRRRFTA
jgi:integral membrane protein (TIGR01906 family)